MKLNQCPRNYQGYPLCGMGVDPLGGAEAGISFCVPYDQLRDLLEEAYSSGFASQDRIRYGDPTPERDAKRFAEQRVGDLAEGRLRVT